MPKTRYLGVMLPLGSKPNLMEDANHTLKTLQKHCKKLNKTERQQKEPYRTQVVNQVMILDSSAMQSPRYFNRHMQKFHTEGSELIIVGESGLGTLGDFDRETMLSPRQLARKFHKHLGDDGVKGLRNILFLTCNSAYHPGIFLNTSQPRGVSTKKSFTGLFHKAMIHLGAVQLTVKGTLGFVQADNKHKRFAYVSRAYNTLRGRRPLDPSKDLVAFHPNSHITLPESLLEPDIDHESYLEGLEIVKRQSKTSTPLPSITELALLERAKTPSPTKALLKPAPQNAEPSAQSPTTSPLSLRPYGGGGGFQGRMFKPISSPLPLDIDSIDIGSIDIGSTLTDLGDRKRNPQ